MAPTLATPTFTPGDLVMRATPGNRPDGPWIVRTDLTDQRGTYVLEDPRYPATATACAVTVQAYPQNLTRYSV
jgi:hypothetical protein